MQSLLFSIVLERPNTPACHTLLWTCRCTWTSTSSCWTAQASCSALAPVLLQLPCAIVSRYSGSVVWAADHTVLKPYAGD